MLGVRLGDIGKRWELCWESFSAVCDVVGGYVRGCWRMLGVRLGSIEECWELGWEMLENVGS